MELSRARELAVARASARRRARQLAEEANAPGFGESLGAGVLQGGADVLGTVARVGDAAAQAVTGESPTERILGLPPQQIMQQQNQQFDDRFGDSTAATVGRIGGQLTTTLPVMAGAGAAARGASRIAPALAPTVDFLSGAGGVSSRLAAGGLQGGSVAGLSSGASESPAKDVAFGTALGAGGMGTFLGARGLGRLTRNAVLPRVSPEAAALAGNAADRGIPINAAQLSNSPSLRLADSVTRRVPFSGAAQHLDDQQAAFNRAVGRVIGVSDDKITQDVFSRAKSATSKEFERLTARNALPISDDLAKGLTAIKGDAIRFGADDTARAVARLVDDEIAGKTVNGMLPGRAYQAVDSLIGRLTKTGGEKAQYLGQVRERLRIAMDDAISPEDVSAWRAARQRWRDLKTIEPLVAKDTVEGNISPALLQGRITADRAGKAAHASGRTGELGELAQIGQRFLKDTVPNSGTADRAALMGLLGGAPIAAAVDPTLGAAAAGVVGGSRLTQALLNNPRYRDLLLARTLKAGATSDPAAQTGVKSLANRLAPYGVPISIAPAMGGFR